MVLFQSCLAPSFARRRKGQSYDFSSRPTTLLPTPPDFLPGNGRGQNDPGLQGKLHSNSQPPENTATESGGRHKPFLSPTAFLALALVGGSHQHKHLSTESRAKRTISPKDKCSPLQQLEIRARLRYKDFATKLPNGKAT